MKKTHATLALCLTLIAAATAQEKQKQVPKPVFKTQRQAIQVINQGEFNLTFPGGNISQLVKHLELNLPEKPNFLVARSAAGLVVPPLKLTRVNLDTLMGALPDFMSSNLPGGGGNNVTLRVSVLKRGKCQIITLYTNKKTNKKRMNTHKSPPIKTSVFNVFNVAELLQGERFKIDDLVTAIETAFEMNNQTPKPTLKYHKETKLLLVKGQDKAMDMVLSVICELRPTDLELTDRLTQEVTTLKTESLNLKVRLAKLEKELAALKKTRGAK